MTFQIFDGMTKPTKAKAAVEPKYPLAQLAIGQGFFIETKEGAPKLSAVRAQVQREARALAPKRFTAFEVKAGDKVGAVDVGGTAITVVRIADKVAKAETPATDAAKAE